MVRLKLDEKNYLRYERQNIFKAVCRNGREMFNDISEISKTANGSWRMGRWIKTITVYKIGSTQNSTTVLIYTNSFTHEFKLSPKTKVHMTETLVALSYLKNENESYSFLRIETLCSSEKRYGGEEHEHDKV